MPVSGSDACLEITGIFSFFDLNRDGVEVVEYRLFNPEIGQAPAVGVVLWYFVFEVKTVFVFTLVNLIYFHCELWGFNLTIIRVWRGAYASQPRKGIRPAVAGRRARTYTG